MVKARDRFRAEHFGIIFQMFNLLPALTAAENVMLEAPLLDSTPRRPSLPRCLPRLHRPKWPLTSPKKSRPSAAW